MLGWICDGECWGLCIVDLDILLFGEEIIDILDFIVFYYGMVECEFVLVLLFEIVFEFIMFDGYLLFVWVFCCFFDGLKCFFFFNCM